MYDLLIRDGEVVDPSQGLHGQRDVGIIQGKIAALERNIAAGEAKEVIDARGRIVTPGLIDCHVHAADGITNFGINPDEVGVFSGVTTLCDGGSTGHATFGGFKRYVIGPARTNLFCLLHMCSVGQAIVPEIWSPQNIDPEAMLKTIEANRDIIKGVKVRAIGHMKASLGIEGIRLAKQIAAKAGLPLAVHLSCGIDETPSDAMMTDFTREWLPMLEKGDMLFHMYTWKEGGAIKPDGSVLDEIRDAQKRGVILDPAHGSGMFSFAIARIGLEKGILPNTISTDVTATNVGTSVNLPHVMSKFLALGLTLDQVVEMTTINPARALREEHRRGSLRPGMIADVSILELTKGDFTFSDGWAKNTLKGRLLLVPRVTVKSGAKIVAGPPARQ